MTADAQVIARDEMSASGRRIAELESSAQQAAAKTAVTEVSMVQLQNELREAQALVAEAEASRRSAELETRRALPQWQEQLQRAELQLRQLAGQLREKDSLLADRDQALAEKEVVLGSTEATLEEARRVTRDTEYQLRQTQRLYEQVRPIPHASTPAPPHARPTAQPTPDAPPHPTPALPLARPIDAHHSARALPQADAEKQRLLLEQAEANDAKYELISLRAEHHAVKREHQSATGAIATLQAQLDEANEALRSLKNNYRQARDELAALGL